jgi:hypothetical protein
MDAKEKGESFIKDAEMQGFIKHDAIDIAMFAVDKIINHTGISLHEYHEWIEVMDYLESIRLS